MAAPDVRKIFREGTLIEEALRNGARRALEDHRRLGLPLLVRRDGKAVWVTPDEFERILDSRPAGA